MKAGWIEKTVGEICNFQRGLTFKRADAVEFSSKGVLRANNIDRETGTLNLSDIKYIRENFEIPSNKMINKGSLLICTASGSKRHLGKVALIDIDDALAFGGFMGQLTPTSEVLPKFLYYFTCSDHYYKYIQSLTDGANINNLRFNQLSQLQFLLPPLEEQKRIVAILDEAFVGLDRARAHTEANLQNAKDLFASVLQDCFDKRAEWQKSPLIDEVRFIDYRGKTPPKTPEGIRLITAKNVKKGYVNTHPEEFMDKLAFDDWMTRGTPQKGDILFTTEAPLGHVATLNRSQPVVIGQRLITMQSSQTYFSNEFLKYSLMSPQMQKEIHLQSSGTTVVGIKSKLLKQIPIYFPKDKNLQKSVINKCSKAFETMNELSELQNKKLKDLDDLRQSLLQKAFAGELT